jgi:hypothetical protein
MPNGFEHPLHGEEVPQAVKRMLEEIAAEAAETRYEAFDARNFAFAGSERFANDQERYRCVFWEILERRYVNWAMANDDDFLGGDAPRRGRARLSRRSFISLSSTSVDSRV